MARFLISLLLGAAVTFGLFVFMAYLINSGDGQFKEQKETIQVEIMSAQQESKVQERKRVPPPPPPPPKTPPKVQPPAPQTNDVKAGGININPPQVAINDGANSLSGPGAFGRDGDATPIVRIEPKYPVEAARDGKEGWVRLSFTIMEDGSVGDIEVIDAEPKRIFDREAKRALGKWKYRAKVEDGKPVRQPGLTVQLDFKLNQANN